MFIVCENDAWGIIWLSSCVLGYSDRDLDQRIILELDVSQGRGRGPEETSLVDK